MDRAEIEAKVKEILADQLDVDMDKIQHDSDLATDLGMDSFATVELLFELNEQLGVDVPEDDVTNIRTVKEIVDLVQRITGGED